MEKNLNNVAEKEIALREKIYKAMVVQVKCDLTTGRSDNCQEQLSDEHVGIYLTDNYDNIRTAADKMYDDYEKDRDLNDLDRAEADWYREYLYQYIPIEALIPNNFSKAIIETSNSEEGEDAVASDGEANDGTTEEEKDEYYMKMVLKEFPLYEAHPEDTSWENRYYKLMKRASLLKGGLEQSITIGPKLARFLRLDHWGTNTCTRATMTTYFMTYFILLGCISKAYVNIPQKFRDYFKDELIEYEKKYVERYDKHEGKKAMEFFDLDHIKYSNIIDIIMHLLKSEEIPAVRKEGEYKDYCVQVKAHSDRLKNHRFMMKDAPTNYIESAGKAELISIKRGWQEDGFPLTGAI